MTRVGTSRPQCPTCYEVLDRSDTFALLCGHTFHDQCITKWLDDSKEQTCPCCRVVCPKEYLLKVYFDFPEAKERRKKAKKADRQSHVDRAAGFLSHRHEEVSHDLVVTRILSG